MGITKRAWLYVTRKRGKTFLLMIILLFIATFVLSALTIGRVAEQAHKSVLEAVGGKFTIGIGNGKDNPYYVQEELGENRYSITNIGPKLTQTNIEEIMSLGDIRNYHADVPTDALVPDLEIVEGTLPPTKGFEHLIRGYAVSGSESSDFFISRTLTLMEGRHIAPEDTGVTLISDAFAEKNSLQLGDTIFLEISDDVAESKGIPLGQKTPVKIVGIFTKTENYSSDPGALSEPLNMVENLYFTDMSIHTLMYKETNDFYQAIFYAKDPENIQQIIDKVHLLNSIDWKQFEVIVDTEVYNTTVKPIEMLRSTVNMMLLVAIAVSVIILSLVLAMWLKSRIYEAGVFLSIGISKAAILAQFLMEAMLIAVIAFGISFLIGSFAIPQVGESFVNYNAEKQTIQASDGEDLGAVGQSTEVGVNGEKTINMVQPVETLEIIVQPVDFKAMCLIGFLVVIISVSVASVPILRLKPKKIFSLMS